MLDPFRALGDVLDDVPIAVPRREGHVVVHAGRIATQHRLRDARPLDEGTPIDIRHRAQARDAVRHHELRQREMLRRSLHGLVDGHHVFRDPLLQPEQRREVGAAAADLLEEARDERGRESRRLCDEPTELEPERRTLCVLRGEEASDPQIRVLGVLHIAIGPTRHAADVLEEAHAQHRGHRPQLAHRERRDALVLPHHEIDAGHVEAAVGVRDQLDGQLVYARVSSERTLAHQLRQLAIVAARQCGPDLVRLLEHYVEVVEQPVARGADGDAGGDRLGEAGVHGAQVALDGVEPREEQSAATLADGPGLRPQLLLVQPRQTPRMTRELIGSEQLSEDRIAPREPRAA